MQLRLGAPGDDHELCSSFKIETPGFIPGLVQQVTYVPQLLADLSICLAGSICPIYLHRECVFA